MFSKMDFNARNMNFETTIMPADAEVPIIGTRNMHNVTQGVVHRSHKKGKWVLWS